MVKQLFVVSAILLMVAACSDNQPTRLVAEPSPIPAPTPVVITVEVTRQVEITPRPQPTSTPIQIIVTRLVEAPTPTKTAVPTADGCYVGAFTQWAMNVCSAERRDGAFRRMKNLIAQVLDLYRDEPADTIEFSKLQTEWEGWADRECDFRWTRIITGTNGMLLYEHGSWAPMQGNECLVGKYQRRIQEIQGWFEHSH